MLNIVFINFTMFTIYLTLVGDYLPLVIICECICQYMYFIFQFLNDFPKHPMNLNVWKHFKIPLLKQSEFYNIYFNNFLSIFFILISLKKILTECNLFGMILHNL